jgi:hypothetical protein
MKSDGSAAMTETDRLLCWIVKSCNRSALNISPTFVKLSGIAHYTKQAPHTIKIIAPDTTTALIYSTRYRYKK